MVTCLFTEEFGRLSLGCSPHSVAQVQFGGTYSPVAAKTPPFQNITPPGMRNKPRFLTVEIPNGITDDTGSDAYQRMGSSGDSPSTPWAIGPY
mmetsp:Transcript_25324/g.65199  ORF Transcript_25324/g.65199 Transcript_25324/m.65199 type:complete len:93 (-) Transcript_25324:282-560(-)|eukprot:jgi/Tetstr1/444291/TSEL_032182.t1